MTKPIIVVKVPCKLLYVIQVKEFLIKCSTSWPYLISEFLVANITIVASDWPRTFFTRKVFLFSISVTQISVAKGIHKICVGLCYIIMFSLTILMVNTFQTINLVIVIDYTVYFSLPCRQIQLMADVEGILQYRKL